MELNHEQVERERLTSKFGRVWDTQELQQDFTVVGFLAPYVEVIRRSDGKRGSLCFQHQPRFYYQFEEA